MIFADTSAWYAVWVKTDPNHLAAARWLRQNKAQLIISDYIVDETLTLLRSRGQPLVALEVGRQLFSGEFCDIYYLTQQDIQEAWTVFQRYSDKEWSFTDCTSKVVMERLGVTQAFAFDQHFRQFGSVEVVP